MTNPWTEINAAAKSFRVEDLGRPAFFLLPVHKLEVRNDPSGLSVEDKLHRFLMGEYGAFTTATIPSFGIWRNETGIPVGDECRQYRVAFPGKERIPKLLEKLAEIALLIGEDCIYVEAGEDAGLVYAKRPSP